MKKIIFYVLALLALGMAACFEDNSTLGTDFIPDIEISGLRDTTIVSYSGNVLEITPEIVTEYKDSELSYMWYIMTASNLEEIGEGKTLSYEVNLPSGTYTIMLQVTALDYDYSRRATMQLSTTTAFAEGYYILKETADGRSELDLVNSTGLNQNLMTTVLGAPLEGAPFNLTVTYGQCYIKEETQGMPSTKAVNVFTEKSVHIFRTEDLKQIHDPSTMFYAGAPQEGERFYSVGQKGQRMYLFTNKGFYSTNTSACTGKYGNPLGTCASKHVQIIFNLISGGIAYWNEAERLLYWGDSRGTQPLDYELPEDMDAATVECVASGTNYVGGVETVWFLLRDAANNRCLVLPVDTKSECDVVAVDPASRFAQAEVVAGNTRSAAAVYFVSDNRLWAYRLDGTSEYEIPLPGVEGTITYISNPFITVNGRYSGIEPIDWNSLVVATETSEGYHLYVWDKEDLVGGAPQRTVEPFKGSGKVKAVRYLHRERLNMLDMDFGECTAIPWTD